MLLDFDALNPIPSPVCEIIFLLSGLIATTPSLPFTGTKKAPSAFPIVVQEISPFDAMAEVTKSIKFPVMLGNPAEGV